MHNKNFLEKSKIIMSQNKFIPILGLIFVGVIFSSNYLFKGLVPFPSRYLVNHFSPWNTNSEFAMPVKNNAMPDVIGQIYPWKNFTIETWKSGEIPLWNPYSFSGTPHLANYQSQVFSPTNLLYFFLPFLDAWSIQILLQPLLAGIFMYLYMQSIKASRSASLLSSLSFMFCGFITTWMAYGTLAYAILYLPLGLYAVERYLRKRDVVSLVTLAISICFSFFSGHFQTSIYMYGTVIVYILWNFIFARNIKDTLILLGTSFSGLFLSFPQIIPSIEFYQNSIREQIVQKMEVIPWEYLPTRIAPDFYGNPVTRNDWFGHYAEWNSYGGIIPFFLSFFAISRKINRRIWFFVLLFIISILLSFDTFLADLMVHLRIPLLSTSAASRIIVLSSISIGVLGGLGFDKLLKIEKLKNALPTVGIWFVIIASLWVVIFSKNLEMDKVLIARNNSILPSALFFALTGLVIAFTILKNKKLREIIVLGIIFLTAFEMLRFALKWMPFEERKFVYPATSTTEEFQKLSSYDRWFLDTHAENALIYRLPISDGYDPLYYKRYGEFMKYIADGKIAQGDRSVVTFPKNGEHTNKALDLLGIKYIAYRVSDGRAPWAFPYWEYPDGKLVELFHDGKYTIFENTQHLPKAYVVSNVVQGESDEKILKTLFDEDFDSSQSAIIERQSNVKGGADNGTVAITSYSNNSVLLNANLSRESLVVLGDVLYPGWKAYVDGEKREIERVNYIFRGVFVSQGEHKIEFKYEPESFEKGIWFMLFGMIGIVVLSIINGRYAKKE